MMSCCARCRGGAGQAVLDARSSVSGAPGVDSVPNVENWSNIGPDPVPVAFTVVAPQPVSEPEPLPVAEVEPQAESEGSTAAGAVAAKSHSVGAADQ